MTFVGRLIELEKKKKNPDPEDKHGMYSLISGYNLIYKDNHATNRPREAKLTEKVKERVMNLTRQGK